jgi:hypothetical protein
MIRFTPTFSIAVQAAASEPPLSIHQADRDTLLRMAAFEHVRRLGEVHDRLTAAELKPGFVFNGAPAVKAWSGLVDHLQEDTGWPREKVVSVLKSIPIGKRVLDMAAAEL